MDKQTAQKLLAYYRSKGYQVFEGGGRVNIFYIEGASMRGRGADFEIVKNPDRPDEWNDLRGVMLVENGVPEIVFCAVATTEPGIKSTNSKEAAKLGGVARIPFGQYTVWRMGFHKGDKSHPALVQCRALKVYADKNKDGKRTGDMLRYASGINQHGAPTKTKPPRVVGGYSAGCLVGWEWEKHLYFIGICMTDPGYIANKNFEFTSVIINGDEFDSFRF